MNTTVATPAATSINHSATKPFVQTADSGAATVRSVVMLLKAVFTIVPIVAGLDKFTDLLVNWDSYINPMLANLLPLSAHAFMGIVGVIEIAAGVLVFARPRLGASVVAAWLICISLSLLASGHFLDVAVRDLVMAVSAITLARLTPVAEAAHSSKH